MHNEAALQIVNLKKYFDVEEGLFNYRNAKLKAVDDVSFDVYSGETFGLVGESGCGKSTLGKLITRLLEPTAGHIFFEGTDLAYLSNKRLKSIRQKIQIIFQDPSASLNPRRTIHDTLMEPFIVHNLYTPAEREKKINFLIDKVGLASYHMNRFPHELSGGQKQRIGIARALSLNPTLIVCDEPLSALDVSVQAQTLNLMQDLQKEFNLTYIFISHNLNVVYQISDRVGVMYLGRMVEVADYDQLYANPLHPYTQALLSAIPQVNEKNKKSRIILQGDVPNPINPPNGCHFHLRCNKAFDRCFVEEPKRSLIDESHFVVCHLYDNPVPAQAGSETKGGK
jgi:oligopeptide transport system ATP-binding protein